MSGSTPMCTPPEGMPDVGLDDQERAENPTRAREKDPVENGKTAKDAIADEPDGTVDTSSEQGEQPSERAGASLGAPASVSETAKVPAETATPSGAEAATPPPEALDAPLPAGDADEAPEALEGEIVAQEAPQGVLGGDVDYSEFDVPGADPSADVDPVVIESTPEQIDEAAAFFDRAKDKETKNQKKRAAKVSRVFSVMQYRAHSETGEVMLTQEQIDEGLEKLSDRLHKWAYVWHDDDRVVEVDEGTGEMVCVGLKGVHVHMVIWVNDHSRSTIRTVSDALKIPSARVQTPREMVEAGEGHKGRGAAEKSFFDLCEYLTHESRRADAIAGVYQSERSYLVDKEQDCKPGKFQYGRGRVVASFDFGRELDAHMATRRTAAEGGGGAKLSKLFQAVGTGAMTLREVRDTEPLAYYAKGNLEHFRKLRGDYLAHQAAPESVMNFYIYGPGGVGKDLLGKTLARALAPDEEKPYFKVGGENVSWEGYDGEPVVIWEDMRVGDMMRTAKSRGMLFRILGPWREPDEKPVVNVKHSRTQLLNRVNIVTGPEDYNSFLRGLAGEYESMQGGVKVEHKAENVAQGYRRFPLIIPVGEQQFGIFVNLGFLNGTREYESYEKFGNFSQNLEAIRNRCKAIEDEAERLRTLEMIERKTVAPIIEQHDRLLSTAQETVSADDVIAEFADAGKPLLSAPEPPRCDCTPASGGVTVLPDGRVSHASVGSDGYGDPEPYSTDSLALHQDDCALISDEEREHRRQLRAEKAAVDAVRLREREVAQAEAARRRAAEDEERRAKALDAKVDQLRRDGLLLK